MRPTFNCNHQHRYSCYEMASNRFFISDCQPPHTIRVEWRMPNGPCRGYSPMSGIWHKDGGYWTVIFVNLLLDCCGGYNCLGKAGKPHDPHVGKPNAGIQNAENHPAQKRFPSLIQALLAGRKHVMVDGNDQRVRDLLEVRMPWRKTDRLKREQQRRTA